MTNEDFVTYEIAQALKKAGFDWPTQAYFAVEPDNSPDLWVSGLGAVRSTDLQGRDVLAPTLAQAQKWLRKTKGIEIVVEPLYYNYKHIGYDWRIYDDCSGDCSLRAPLPFCDSYESALSAGIKGVLKLINKEPNKEPNNETKRNPQ